MADIKNPGLAAVLSAVIPGIGQFYNGDFLRGIFWLIVTPGLWLGTGGLRLRVEASTFDFQSIRPAAGVVLHF